MSPMYFQRVYFLCAVCCSDRGKLDDTSKTFDTIEVYLPHFITYASQISQISGTWQRKEIGKEIESENKN
jgi:hypothetical protein